jgi:hypothetical protein
MRDALLWTARISARKAAAAQDNKEMAALMRSDRSVSYSSISSARERFRARLTITPSADAIPIKHLPLAEVCEG